jgi:hypothetical protein
MLSSYARASWGPDGRDRQPFPGVNYDYTDRLQAACAPPHPRRGPPARPGSGPDSGLGQRSGARSAWRRRLRQRAAGRRRHRGRAAGGLHLPTQGLRPHAGVLGQQAGRRLAQGLLPRRAFLPQRPELAAGAGQPDPRRRVLHPRAPVHRGRAEHRLRRIGAEQPAFDRAGRRHLIGSATPGTCVRGACQLQRSWASVLDEYNNGDYPGAPEHCDED